MSGYPRRPTRDDTSVVGARIGAQIIDTIIVSVLFFLAVFVMSFFGGLFGGLTGTDVAGGFALLGFLIGGGVVFLYWFLLEGMWDGYTVGKRLFGIKVVEEDGSSCSLGSAFIRNLFRIVDALFYYLVGFVAMAMSDNRQRIGDLLAGTVVVREQPESDTATSAARDGTDSRDSMPGPGT